MAVNSMASSNRNAFAPVSAEALAKHQAENLSQTRREHASELAEDYVEAIADLTTETGEARVVDLARRLGVTHVTVNRAIARFKSRALLPRSRIARFF